MSGVDADTILEERSRYARVTETLAARSHARRARRQGRAVSAELSRKNPASLFAIVLAAGASTRFGSPKQLVRIRGRPLLHTAVTRASEVTGSALIVVLGSGAAELGALLKHSPGSIVINQDWREGLASSIRAGIARLPLTCAGALLLLADQPGVSSR